MRTRRMAMVVGVLLAGGLAQAAQTGETGWDVRRPVLAAACPHACPWGELGDFVREAMAPLGYDVVLCRNCNRDRGARLVATASEPPPLDASDARVGTTVRVEAPVDFGVTAAGFLAAGWAGEYPNLRLIAKIEDPMYLLVAIKAESGITDLAQIAERQLPVRFLTGSGAAPVLDYYGLTEDRVTSWGGSFGRSMDAEHDVEFDVIIDDLGSPAMNPESAQWTRLSQHYDLRFLELPGELLDELAERSDYRRVTVKWGLLRGVDRVFETVGRNGQVIFARAETPDQAAYDVARAIDEHRAALRWYVRPYAYDPDTVFESQGVPLHPGAERYYRERGSLE